MFYRRVDSQAINAIGPVQAVGDKAVATAMAGTVDAEDGHLDENRPLNGRIAGAWPRPCFAAGPAWTCPHIGLDSCRREEVGMDVDRAKPPCFCRPSARATAPNGRQHWSYSTGFAASAGRKTTGITTSSCEAFYEIATAAITRVSVQSPHSPSDPIGRLS